MARYTGRTCTYLHGPDKGVDIDKLEDVHTTLYIKVHGIPGMLPVGQTQRLKA